MLRENKTETRHTYSERLISRLRLPEWADAISARAKASVAKRPPTDDPKPARRGWRDLGLPAKLLLLTLAFVSLAEVLIFLPAISSYRLGWLDERLIGAQLATLAAEGFPGGDVPSGLRTELLRTAQVKAIASRRRDGGAMGTGTRRMRIT